MITTAAQPNLCLLGSSGIITASLVLQNESVGAQLTRQHEYLQLLSASFSDTLI
jgi:hypothetical protein